jgi:hypothetical protein
MTKSPKRPCDLKQLVLSPVLTGEYARKIP